MSNLIIQLRGQTETKLGSTISSVVVTSPNLKGILSEDLDDAIEFAGLRSLLGVFPSRVPETFAALAGNGFGLCANYTSHHGCEIEEEEMPLEQVLAIQGGALNMHFLNTLHDALSGIQTSNTVGPQITTAGLDPLYAAAKGAPEFAKRLQEAPRNCIQPRRCQHDDQEMQPTLQNELK
ncbi:hypothetical protein MMC17_009603 [Xylographa soralifera]|nr:hypothetical protein [Xylographa soralifera]